MVEEKKSVLSSEEIDFVAGLIPEGEEGAHDRDLLDREKGLSGEKRLRKIWDAWQERKWENVLNAIKEIPADRDLLMMANFPGRPYVSSIARTSVSMLLKHAISHLSTEQVKLVDEVLKRIDENEQGLGKEPWKTLFLEMAGKYFPDDTEEMIKAVTEMGISEDEYTRISWHHVFDVINGDVESLTGRISGNFVKNATYIGACRGVDLSLSGEKFLRVADILLSQKNFDRACGVYKELQRQGLAEIGTVRQEIVETQNKWNAGKLIRRRRDKKIAKKSKII